MRPVLICLFALSCLLVADSPTSAQDSTESWWKPWSWYNDEIAKHDREIAEVAIRQVAEQMQQNKALAMKKLTDQTRSVAAWAALIYLIATMVAPSLVEWFRAQFSMWFRIPPDRWRQIAHALFTMIAVIVVGATLVNPDIRPFFVGIMILLAGACYSFFLKVLPAIASGDAVKRKSSLGEVKGFIVLITTFMIVAWMVAGKLTIPVA